MKKIRAEKVIFVKLVLLAGLVSLVIIGCGGKKKGGVAGNNPPEIVEATLQPPNPTMQSEISARILGSDKDGDPITYKVKWFVNDVAIGEGMVFKYEEAKKGDKILADVTPNDGKEDGVSVRTAEVVIGSTPPRIVSLKISPESLFTTTPQVTVTATVEDLDKDTVNLFVNWLVKDEVIKDTSNVLNLAQYKLKKNDVITASAYARDGISKSEPFPFELHIANSAPMFRTRIDSVKANPDTIYYQLPVVDPDGDRLTFEMIQAPTGIYVEKNTGVVYGSAPGSSIFEVVVRATDTEGAYLDARFTLIGIEHKE